MDKLQSNLQKREFLLSKNFGSLSKCGHSKSVKYLEVFSSKLDQLILLPYSREKVRFLFWLIILRCFNPLRANFTKWSNTLKHFVGILPTNCLSVFGHFVGLALKGLRKFLCGWFLSSCNYTLELFSCKIFFFDFWSFNNPLISGVYKSLYVLKQTWSF